MIRNYFKIAFRQMVQNKFYVLVNIFGLSMGIACCVLGYFNWEFHARFDQGHENLDRIFKINTEREVENTFISYGLSPEPVADIARSSFEKVENSAKIMVGEETVKRRDELFKRSVLYVEPSFLDIFSFKAVKGNIELTNKQSVIITERLAKDLFGLEDPVGKDLSVALNKQDIELYNIIGVVKTPLLNSSFDFDILIHHEIIEDRKELLSNNWGQMVHATFLLLKSKVDAPSVQTRLQTFVKIQNEKNEDWKVSEFKLVPLKEMANVARYIRGNYLRQNNPEGAIMIPTIMAIIIMIIACLNFINTNIALSDKRQKEIGVRKSMGSSRIQVAVQLLFENFSLLIMALLLGMVLAEFLVPLYNQLGPWINLKINYVDNITFFGFITAFLIVTGLIAGGYPAFYISKFETTNIFRGKIAIRGTERLSKILMVLQLSFSLISIIQGIIYIQNSTFQGNFDLGFNRDQIISVPLDEGVDFNVYKSAISDDARLENVAGAVHHIGFNLSSGYVNHGAIESEVRKFSVGANYLNTMQIELLEGRWFVKDSENDFEESIVVNQEFINTFDIIETGIQQVLVDDKPYYIVGVVKDFYPFGLWRGELKRPAMFTLASESDFNYLAANVSNSNLEETNQMMKEKWNQLYPNILYQGEIQNPQVYLSELLSYNMAVMNMFLAVTALVLSSIGLYTMISLTIIRRRKEIGVRKVLGASIQSMILLINRGFFLILLGSVIIGSIGGAYLSEMFLSLMFVLHSKVGVTTVLFSGGLVMISGLATIGFKVYKSATLNPVKSLRYE